MCTLPPDCSPLVLHLARRWVAPLTLVGCRYTSKKACSRETHSPSRASKTYGYNVFQVIHLHSTVINTYYSTPHTLWALTAATVLADAAVTPPSPKWPKNVSSGTLNLAQSNPRRYQPGYWSAVVAAATVTGQWAGPCFSCSSATMQFRRKLFAYKNAYWCCSCHARSRFCRGMSARLTCYYYKRQTQWFFHFQQIAVTRKRGHCGTPSTPFNAPSPLSMPPPPFNAALIVVVIVKRVIVRLVMSKRFLPWGWLYGVISF